MPNKELIYKAKAKYELRRRKKQNPLNYFVPIDHPELQQKEFLESEARNQNIFGGNRSSKSVSGAVKVISKCLENPGYDCWAVTWADMSVAVQQAEYNKWLPKDKSLIKYASFSEQRGFLKKIIIFANNSKIRFKTYEQGWESFQGASKDIIHLDEEAPEEIVNECKARLMDRDGMLLRTMTPLNGVTYTYDEVIINSKNDKEIVYWFFNSDYNHYVNAEARERILSGYAEKEREVRSKGHFLNLTSGQVYYAFDHESNVAEFNYMPNRPLEISCDFNVALMCWSIGQELNGKDFEFDAVELEGLANTDLMCKMLKSKYSDHSGGWIFYGDIAGGKRDPASATSSWGIIQSNFPDAKIYYQSIGSIKDRTDATNGRLHNAKGQFLFVSKKCNRLKTDLMRVTWEMLINKGKAGNLTHASDGLSYKIFWKYPLFGRSKLRGVTEL